MLREERKRCLEERWRLMMERNKKQAGEQITWDDCIRYLDEAIKEIGVRMALDPEHGVHWQQQMALMMVRHSEAMVLKRSNT